MASHTKPQLKRVVGTPLLTLYGIGNIVGAGVYVLIGKIADPAGYLAILAFLVAALIAFCAALSYAELAARFPVSAGVAVYLHEAFKAKRLSTLIGIMLVGAGVVSSATLLKGFAGYFGELVAIPGWLSMALVALVLMAVMLRGIKESVGVAGVLTIIEVSGLVFLVGSILWAEPQAAGDYFNHFSQAVAQIDGALLAGVMSAAFIAFYAFVGFEDMVNIAEEVKKPQTAFPRAILVSMGVVTLLYLAVAAVTLGVLDPAALSSSKAPLAAAFETATGKAAGIIVVISLLATLNGVLVNIIMGSRFLYGMAKRQWIPGWFGKVSKRHIPARGVITVGVLGLGAALWLPIERLAQITSLLLLFVFLAVNVSLIVIRRRDTPQARQIRIAPRVMPWIGAVASVGLLVAQAVILLFDL